MLTVTDTGMGIPEADVPRLFDEFFRASNAKTSKIEGSGVGLAGAKALVERFGGKLTIKTSGLFVSPGALETRDSQKSRVKAIVGHVIPGAKVADFTLKSLSNATFEVEAEIESGDPLEKLHGAYELALAQTSPAFADVSIPLDHAQRETPALLVGPFDERIELNITWPESCSRF